jgi:sugar phosphate isomerase/epimerase
MNSGTAAVRAATSMVDRPIGYVAADMGGRSVQEILALLAAAGYEAVDWTMEQYDPLAEPTTRLMEIVRQSHAAGLDTPQLMVHQDQVTADGALWEQRVRRAERAVEGCAAAGIASVGVLTGPNLWEPGHVTVSSGGGRTPSGCGLGSSAAPIPEAEAWELAFRALERVLARGEQLGVQVALEPCWGTLARDRYRAEYALARLDCAALAVNFDPSHFVLSGDDIPGAVRAWGERIAHVHLKDAFGVPADARSPREGEDFTFLLPGEGAVPWPALLDALEAVDYHGAMCVENEAFKLLRGPLGGDLARSAALARELVGGLLDA